MRVVNLARRPFVNRRPVVRMAIFLWVVAALLVLANLKLFSGYLFDSREIRAEIAETEAALATEARGVDQQSSQVRGVNLGDRNRQALFLNSLISYRTFPWSALFDDLEQVLPHEVRLQSVQPVVRLASEQALSRAEQQAREQAREQRRSSRRRSRAATTDRRNQRPEAEEDAPIAQDEVKLELRGAAKNEEALILFVDTLYQNPDFRSPFLRNESMSSDGAGPAVFFSIEVLYRTGKRFETEEDGGPSDQVAEATPSTEAEATETPVEDQAVETTEPPQAVVADSEAPPASPEVSEEASVAAAPPPSPPPPVAAERTPEQQGRDRQLDEELAAARRAAAERANEEEAEQNREETEREPVVDARRKRLEELRERARRRRESREAAEARGQARIVLPGATGGQQANPPRGQNPSGRPTGTGGAAQPPTSPRDDLNDDPGFAETPASGSPTLGGGMASLVTLAEEAWA